MKNRTCSGWLFPALLLMAGFLRLSAQEAGSLPAREVVRSLMAGGGFAHMLDTYLSPLEYTGEGACMLFENLRMTHLRGKPWLSQHQVQLDYSYTHNPSRSAYMHSGMVLYAYSLQRPFRLAPFLTGYVGPEVEASAGVVYNHRNSNNPAQAKAFLSVGATARLAAACRVGRLPLRVGWQVHLPLVGIAFSPHYGESYYEMFSLGEGGWHNVVMTSLHNRPSLRQLLILDVPLGRGIGRVGYLADFRQSRLHHLKYHSWTHSFLIGYVRYLRLLDARRRFSSHSPF